MPTFEITAPDGKKYRVTGDNADGALEALQGHLGGDAEAPDPNADALSQTRTGLGGFIEGIPIAGPIIRRGTEMAAAGTMAAFDPEATYSDYMGRIDEMNAGEKAANPGIDIGSQLAGSIASTGAAAGTALGAKALGMGGKTLGARMLQSGASGLGVAAADQAARDVAQDGKVSPENVTGASAIGGALGAAIPGVGYAGRKALGGIAQKAGDFTRAVLDPTKQAARKVGQAIDLDRAGGLAGLSADDIAAAGRNNQPLMNADLGGETTRALTRAAANQSPEARGAITRAVQDRYSSQAARLGDKVKGLVDDIDDVGTVERIKEVARLSNAPAYRKAYEQGDKAIWSSELERLASSPTVQSAMRGAQNVWRDVAIADGFGAMNPSALVDKGGQLQFLNGKVNVFPNLQFWDYTKRILDDRIGVAVRSGQNQKVKTLTTLKNALVKELDNVAPAYAKARSGAASYFQAEDAVEAGKKFFKSSRMLPEFKEGIMKMTPPEREAFKVGFASEIIDAAAATSDRQNVISRYFSSPESRTKIRMAFGKPAAQEFEAFVRVENAMDMLRNSLGNSTTARQLIESGIGGAGLGGATWWYTGDLNSGIAATAVGAAGRLGARAAGKKINEQVMKQTAEMLLSNDPQVIQKAIQMAAKSPQHMAAIDAITKMLGVAARGAAVQASTE